MIKSRAIPYAWVMLLVGSILAAAPLSAQQWPPPPPVLAIVGATLIDGTGAPAVPDAVVVFQGERIVCAGTAEACPLPEGARTIDGTGRWVIPGLIDTHVHLYWLPQAGEEEQPWVDGRNGDKLRQQLAWGVTTIREASTHLAERQTLALRDASHVPEIPWPRIYVSGRVDQRAIARHGAAGAGELTARLIELGVDGIKIRNGLTLDDVVAAVAEARRSGLPVYGHASDVDEHGDPVYTTEEAVLAGVAGVMHLSYAPVDPHRALPRPSEPWGGENEFEWWMAVHNVPWLHVDSARAAERIRLMVERGVWLEPTLAVTQMLSQPEPMPSIGFVLPWNEAQRDTAFLAFRESQRFVLQFYQAGGRLLAGTDHGEGIHHDLRLLVESGLSPMSALQAATRNAALALEWEDRVGTVEAGKLADLVILDADPLDDIHNTRRIWRVVKGGILYGPEALRIPGRGGG